MSALGTIEAWLSNGIGSSDPVLMEAILDLRSEIWAEIEEMKRELGRLSRQVLTVSNDLSNHLNS